MPAEMDHSDLAPVHLSSSLLAHGEDFAWPWGILPVGEWIVVTDRPWLEGAVHILSGDSGERLMTIGRAGQGPGEYSGYPKPLLSPGCGPGQFWLYDSGTRRLTQVDLSKSGSEGFDQIQIVGIPFADFPRSVGFLSDSLLVVSGYFREGRVGLWDRTNDSFSILGDLPAWESEVPGSVLQEAYQGPLVIRPGGQGFALASERASRIELYSAEDGFLGLAEVPFEWEPDFTLEERGG
ncbi:MAG: hypothetical protein MUO50_09770, partial [Longimicrobiales bacterium]|nr:hypothetical protein [Longimicrobiales bacterium]